MSELIPTVHAMAKQELLVDLWLAQPGAPGVSTMHRHYYSVIFDGSTRELKTKLSPSPFASSTNSGRLFNILSGSTLPSSSVAGTQLSQVLMESLFTDL